jgi:hypothetical protein
MSNTKTLDCPECYGGHFRPCQRCGDTGKITITQARRYNRGDEVIWRDKRWTVDAAPPPCVADDDLIILIDQDKDARGEIQELPILALADIRPVVRVNLTQHDATPEQRCIEPPDKARVQRLITFDSPPRLAEMIDRAKSLADIAVGMGATHAMIGGAPYFMATLEEALCERGIEPVYSFSRRESVDSPQPDGSVRKVATFRHSGWVEK